MATAAQHRQKPEGAGEESDRSHSPVVKASSLGRGSRRVFSFVSVVVTGCQLWRCLGQALGSSREGKSALVLEYFHVVSHGSGARCQQRRQKRAEVRFSTWMRDLNRSRVQRDSGCTGQDNVPQVPFSMLFNNQACHTSWSLT